MITAKQAINAALIYMKDVYPKISDFELEEIELSDDKTHWSITISMPDKKAESTITLALAPPPRKYKSVVIDNKTGIVKAMKIRKL